MSSQFFCQQWDEVPMVWLDTETTGVQPGRDQCVQIGITRFEKGAAVGSYCSLVNPGISIPPEATAIHGIRDEMVAGAPTLRQIFSEPQVIELLDGAQPGAYNGSFDRCFIPPFGDWTWPWVDALVFVRHVDKYVRGSGRHKLAVTCDRHGIALDKAHDAAADSKAAGELFYKIGRRILPVKYSMGKLLGWQRRAEAAQWLRFHLWLNAQPPRPEVLPTDAP